MGKSSGGGGGGGQSTQTVVQNADPWSGQQPYLRHLFNVSQRQYQTGGPQYFPRAGWVPFAPQTEAAMGLQWNRALAGSPVANAARELSYDTLGGQYLTPESNPWLGQYFQSAADQALPMVNATFSQAGRTGADAQMRGIGETMGALGREIYGGAYDRERQRQMQSLLFAPQLAEMDYGDIARAMQVGQMTEAKAAEALQDQMARYGFNQARPETALDRYAARVGGQNYGQQSTGTTTTNLPTYSNPLGGAIGGGLTGAGIGNYFAGHTGAALVPWALGGAALGGLMGILR